VVRRRLQPGRRVRAGRVQDQGRREGAAADDRAAQPVHRRCVDRPCDSEHVYILFSGFSRKFAEGPGAAAAGEGHLYESTNGGQTWKLIDGSTAGFELPDVPGDDLQLLGGGKIVVGTDLGVFYSPDNGAKWYKLGGNLPATIVYDLHVGPDTTSAGDALYAGTHGRGIWKIARPVARTTRHERRARRRDRRGRSRAAARWWSRRPPMTLLTSLA
jgi:hypothetical protein